MAAKKEAGGQSRFDEDELMAHIVASAAEIHNILGSRLCRQAYTQALSHELTERNVPFERDLPLAVNYKGAKLECGYAIDFLVGGRIIVDVLCAESILASHENHLYTFLELTKAGAGIIINFHSPLLKNGIRKLRL